MNKSTKIRKLLFDNRTSLFWVLAALLFALSFIQYHSVNIQTETKKVQHRFLFREKILNEYIQKAINVPNDKWLQFDNFPDDMVLYKYNADTIQSWVNLFPISNDEVDLIPLWYRIHDMNNRNLYNTPLAYVSDDEQYINLGSCWYVIKIVKEKNVKIIAGLKIKTQYIVENSVLTNTVNRHLGLKKGFTSVPVYIDDGHVIYSSDGDALFSIVNDAPLSLSRQNTDLRWISFLFILAALFSYHLSKRTFKSLFLTAVGIFAIWGGSLLLINDSPTDISIFSPSLYADSVFNSLGHLLLCHFFIFLLIIALFISRKEIKKNILSSSLWISRLKKLGMSLIPLALLFYIHFTLKSLIVNSNIALELYRLEAISIYSVLIFFLYALLFLSLLLCIYLVRYLFKHSSGHSILSTKIMVIYFLVISLYTTLTISLYGFRRECESNKVLTDKLAVERDMTLELQLRSIEGYIISDPLIRMLVGVPQGENLIRNRLSELYFWNIAQRYDLRLTICGENELLLTEEYPAPTNCFAFYRDDIILKYGVPLARNSAFYFINNFKNRIRYIGVFSFLNNGRLYNIYLEIDSKQTKDAIGYPALLLDSKGLANTVPTKNYSYAKYFDRRLTSNKGKYNYPIYYDVDKIPSGFSYRFINGYFHFFNKVSDDNLIVVSRPGRTFLPYLVFFSYLFLFYGAIIFIIMGLRKRSKGHLFSSPKRSFRGKITILVTSAMVISLIAMGTGSVIFTINIINENNRTQMEEKLSSVQVTISEMCKYAQQYNEINNMDMYRAMDRVASNTQVDINLYDPLGRLIRSTKPEVFDQYLLSCRINPTAYYNLIYLHKMQVIQEETVASLKYYSLYAPILNAKGNIVAIANIPYFSNSADFREDASSIIAAIINLYLLLLIASIMGGITVSNSITKPLADISGKMREIDISSKPEHIDYKGDDELGTLVKAYNSMVDDLDKSTKKLAQSEREQAWREMARQIAHEIKNPLTPMRLSIQHLVRLRKNNVPDWQEKFDSLSVSLLEQIDILSETATEFSSFAKFYNEEDSSFDLIDVIKEEMILFDNRENISIEFHCELHEAYVFTKKSQISRAFVNLLSNAIQATENKDDGIVRITLTREDNMFKIAVEDNGKGVSQENLNKLFKPNFTTKTSGTGLGLAICKNIIDQCHGEIYYEQSELSGACFVIKLLSQRQE